MASCCLLEFEDPSDTSTSSETDESDDDMDVTDWTNNQDTESNQKRSDIIKKVIKNEDIDKLKTILGSGWDVNEPLSMVYGGTVGILSYVSSMNPHEFNTFEIVKLLLEHGADPNVTHKVNIGDYREPKWVHVTALHEAVIEQGMTDVVKVLLEAGAKCTTCDGSQNPVAEVVKFLIDADAKCPTPDASENILALALQDKFCPPNVIKMLLEHGVDPNDHNGEMENIPFLKTIMNHGSRESGTEIVQLLIEHGADPLVGQGTALPLAAQRGWADVVKMLLDAGAKCTKLNGSLNPLALALQNHDCPYDLIELMLKHGADPNDHDDQYGNVPLLNAIGHETNTVQLLLDHGANPHAAHQVDISGKLVPRTALHQAASKGCTEVVKILLDAGAKCTTSDAFQNPLALAIRSDCSPDLIELLLKHGDGPNKHDDQLENIPLLKAIKECRYGSNSTTIVQMLLDDGANPNVKHRFDNGNNEDGWIERTALDEAVNQGRAEVVELLLMHGAHPNADNDHLESIPLLNAIRHYGSCPKIAQLLLDHGADPNVAHQVNIGGYGPVKWVHRTALDEALIRGWTDVVKMLLAAGVTWKTSEASQTPLALALQQNDCPPGLIKLLLEHWADVNCMAIGVRPIIHRLFTHHNVQGTHIFLKQELDLFFLKGGNINMEDNEHRTALDYAVSERCHGNSVRWMIRHGVDIQSLAFRISKSGMDGFFDAPLILLQAGMRVSHGGQTRFSNMEVTISTWLQENTEPNAYELEEIKEELNTELFDRVQIALSNPKKSNFPQFWTQQMADLLEFSDKSLDVYPEVTCICDLEDRRQQYLYISDQFHRIGEFLSQPQSLQWYSRCCVRENLVSLQPSVVKTLPIPSSLKRYILCHEI